MHRMPPLQNEVRASHSFSVCPFCIYTPSDISSTNSMNTGFGITRNHIAGYLLDLVLMSPPLSKRKADDTDDDSIRSSGTDLYVLRDDISGDLLSAGLKDAASKYRLNPHIAQSEIPPNPAMKNLRNIHFLVEPEGQWP